MKLPEPNSKVLYKSMADGAVLFATEEEVYFGLNTVGARVWELLPPVSRTLDELCAALARAYPQAAADVIRADVIELLRDLADHGLVNYPTAESIDAEADASRTAEAEQARSQRVA